MAQYTSSTNQLADDYSERHRFWADKALAQFGATTNLYFAIAVGFLAYVTDESKIHEVRKTPLTTESVTYTLIILCALFSAFFGAISVVARLYDLRLTRHSLWIRTKTAKFYHRRNESKKYLPDNYIDLSGYTLRQKIGNFISSIRQHDIFITDVEIENYGLLRQKFESLRTRNLLLGDFSWFCLKLQILAVAISIFLYMIDIFFI